MKAKGLRMEKIKPRMEYGIFVGINRKSNEFLIATEEGIRKARTIKRIPKDERWTDDCLKWVKWAPWKRHEGNEEADGEVPDGVKDEDREEKRRVEEKKEDKERVVYIETKSK
eukprot:12411240-Karenia_brevis.AAC.1